MPNLNLIDLVKSSNPKSSFALRLEKILIEQRKEIENPLKNGEISNSLSGFIKPVLEVEILVEREIDEIDETGDIEEINEKLEPLGHSQAETVYYTLWKDWKKNKIIFNKQQAKMFKAVMRGRSLKNNHIISEALYIVFYGTDYSKLEEELKWW